MDEKKARDSQKAQQLGNNQVASSVGNNNYNKSKKAEENRIKRCVIAKKRKNEVGLKETEISKKASQETINVTKSLSSNLV